MRDGNIQLGRIRQSRYRAGRTDLYDPCDAPLQAGTMLQEIEVKSMLLLGSFEVGTILEYGGVKYVARRDNNRKQGQIYEHMILEEVR